MHASFKVSDSITSEDEADTQKLQNGSRFKCFVLEEKSVAVNVIDSLHERHLDKHTHRQTLCFLQSDTLVVQMDERHTHTHTQTHGGTLWQWTDGTVCQRLEPACFFSFVISVYYFFCIVYLKHIITVPSVKVSGSQRVVERKMCLCVSTNSSPSEFGVYSASCHVPLCCDSLYLLYMCVKTRKTCIYPFIKYLYLSFHKQISRFSGKNLIFIFFWVIPARICSMRVFPFSPCLCREEVEHFVAEQVYAVVCSVSVPHKAQ